MSNATHVVTLLCICCHLVVRSFTCKQPVIGDFIPGRVTLDLDLEFDLNLEADTFLPIMDELAILLPEKVSDY